MLEKTEAIILGSIKETPATAYELIKALKDTTQLGTANRRYIYKTIRQLCRQNLISATAKKISDIRYAAEYSITEKGQQELRNTLKVFIVQYDTNDFSIAAYFIDVFTIEEQRSLLQQRLGTLDTDKTCTQQRLATLESTQKNHIPNEY
jgi:DNA-binding PadR family transcriptional regulator